MSENAITGRPLQRISWSEKTKDKHQWFKNTAEWYIKLSNFSFDGNNRKDIRLLYQIYNGQFPAKWFNHITDPLNATNPNHKKWPAKIRPVNILRTNIDLMLGEFPRRPFVYQVNNLGEDGYNNYLDGLSKTLVTNLTDHFTAIFQQEAMAAGIPVEEVPGLEEVELPESVKEKFGSSYKDNEAIRGQRWMKRGIKEYRIKEELQRCFKDWMITGFAYTYKGIENSNLVYERISPIKIDYDKNPDLEYVEDGEWAVCRRLLTISDVVDHYYAELKEEDLVDLETRNSLVSPSSFFQYLSDTYNRDFAAGKVPVYHIVWKGKKPIKILTYPDPVTGELQQIEVDEDYPVDKEAGESAETIWVNEVYETTRLGDKIYTRMQPIPAQRNALNNLSSCKLPYNGRAFSDVHSENISPMEIGLPFQIMYMIVNRTLEMTIAKSKGKILLIDKNAIPRDKGWNDEKFFYYSEALGYALMNRNQIGVDKTWNQYQVMDMSMFDQIKQLIELQNHYKQEWDDILGINRPRKGSTYASDGKAVSEMGLMQSSVITDTIFNLFEQFIEKELQGILDLSKFVNIDGLRRVYNTDDFTNALLDLDPVKYASAELGILLNSAAEETAVFRGLQQNAAAMIQGGAKPSAIIELFRTQSVEELSQNLKKIEEMQQVIDQQVHENEAELQQATDERQRMFAQFQNSLDMLKIDKEWDRKDQNTMIKGEYDLSAAANFKGDGDVDNNGVQDAMEIEDRILARQKTLDDANLKRDELRLKDIMQQRELDMKNKQIKSAEYIADQKNKTAVKTARYKSNKPKKQ